MEQMNTARREPRMLATSEWLILSFIATEIKEKFALNPKEARDLLFDSLLRGKVKAAICNQIADLLKSMERCEIQWQEQ